MAKVLKEWDSSNSMRCDNTTYLVKLEKGDVCFGPKGDKPIEMGPGYMLAEGISFPQGKKYPVCELVRDFVKEAASLDPGYNCIHNEHARRVCSERGALRKNVPGEVWPLVEKGEVLVADYSMSGTNYFSVPEKAAKDFGWIK